MQSGGREISFLAAVEVVVVKEAGEVVITTVIYVKLEWCVDKVGYNNGKGESKFQCME